MLDPLFVAVGIGLLGSVVAGPAVAHGLQLLPQRWRRTTEWLLIAGAVAVAVLADLLSEGPVGGVLVYVLAALPGLLAFLAFRTLLASYRVHRGVGAAVGLWVALIGVSTLYTKQHYAADVIAGALAAYVAYVVFLRSYPREAVAESDRRRAPFRALGVVGIFGVMVAGFWVAYHFQIVVS